MLVLDCWVMTWEGRRERHEAGDIYGSVRRGERRRWRHGRGCGRFGFVPANLFRGILIWCISQVAGSWIATLLAFHGKLRFVQGKAHVFGFAL